MILRGARVAIDAETTETLNLEIDGECLSFSATSSLKPVLDLTGLMILPGLINAHDHLEFNLFPNLGRGPYPNAKSWASDIYRPAVPPLKQHLTLSKRARMIWGGLKNLLSGATTVAHHNPIDDPLCDAAFPVNVVKHLGWAHSLDFSPDLTERFHKTPSGWPFIVHAAEGVDEKAHAEIRSLDALGVLTEHTVLVHAIGMDPSDLDLLRERRCALVWCPSSNVSTYGHTLSPAALQSDLNVLLGTDSALTAPVDLIDELQVAWRGQQISRRGLFEMVTVRSASALRLAEGQGEIREGGVADLVIVEDHGQTPAEALHDFRPEIMIVRGKIRLVSPGWLDRTAAFRDGIWHSITVETRGSWFTDVNLLALHRETVDALGPDYRLAGKRVSL